MRANTAVSDDQIDQLFTSRSTLQGEIATFLLTVPRYKIGQLNLQKKTKTKTKTKNIYFLLLLRETNPMSGLN